MRRNNPCQNYKPISIADVNTTVGALVSIYIYNTCETYNIVCNYLQYYLTFIVHTELRLSIITH